MADSAHRLFCFGLGYTARALAPALLAEGWAVAGTNRGGEAQEELAALGIDAVGFERGHPVAGAVGALAGATHLLSSIAPDEDGDPVLDLLGADIAALGGLRWVGYLSTTGVYGDTGGAMIDEGAALRPTSGRSRSRAAAEAAWLDLARSAGVPVHVFRLAGIYGPGRSALDQVRAGRARRIDKPGHLFSRIHVDDIARVLRASMARPDPGAVYNVADAAPAAPADVTAFACELLGRPPPPAIAFAEARRTMSEMALSFWRDDRRIDTTRIRDELGVRLQYPDYKAGLSAILEAGG